MTLGTLSTTFLTQTVSPPIIKESSDNNIEMYRGLCALLVMINHGTVHPDMLINKFEWPLYVDFFGAGFMSVLVFFCISGYVIGLTNSTSKLNVKDYLKKRIIRLYPIYIISIVMCILITGSFPVVNIIENVFFLQNSLPYFYFNAPVFINYATWSLNYEVLYYLLFILLFYCRTKLWQLILFVLIISCIFIHASITYIVFINYLNLFAFWILGLLFSWKLIKGKEPKTKGIPLLSLLFLHLCYAHLVVGVIILNTLHIYPTTNINVFFDLPFCLLVIATLTGTNNKFLIFNKFLCYILPTGVFIYLIFTHRITEDIRWIMCFLCWILSVLFYFERRISLFIMGKLKGIGKISYALYLLHIPVAMFVKKIVSIDNLQLEIIVKYTLWILLTFSISIVLELYMQPFIKALFNKGQIKLIN